jgi:GNAT superfamily N-acetyltransferase
MVSRELGVSDPAGVLRLLRGRDVASAFELSAQAGWNQTEDDWRLLLELAPRSCWGIEVDGFLAATTTLVCYGRRLAWIGMVLTRKEFQRRGLAKRLFAQALQWADNSGIETAKLDATEQGRPLYETFGFRADREIQRWGRAGDGGAAVNHSKRDSASIEDWAELDRERFGADRSELLGRLARRNTPLVESRSYLSARAGRGNAYLGPCVAETSGIATRLITRCVERNRCGWVWDLFPQNAAAMQLARDLGFAPQRHLTRMSRGKQLHENVNAIYAIAGFELG